MRRWCGCCKCVPMCDDWLGRACVIAVSQVSGNGSRAISTHVLRRGREPVENDGVVNLRSKSKGDYSTNGGEFSSRGALSFTQTNSADAPFVWAAFRPLPHAEDKFFRCFDEAALLANWIWWARRLWAAMNNSETWVTRSLPQRPPLINRNFSLCLIFVDYLPARFREAKKFTKRLRVYYQRKLRHTVKPDIGKNIWRIYSLLVICSS